MSVGCNPKAVYHPCGAISVECEPCMLSQFVKDEEEAIKVANDHLDETIRKLRAFLKSGC